MKLVISKSELMARVIHGREHECFEHSECGFFDITLMREWAKKHGVRITVGTADMVPHIHESRDYDPERVLELPDESWKNDPPLAVALNDGTHLLIDGAHRILRRHAEGYKNTDILVLTEEEIIRPGPGWSKQEAVDWGTKEIGPDGELVDREKS
jgi:hypothetical protein